MDIGIYAINGACLLMGEEPTEVSAWIFSDKSDPRFAEVEDQVHFTLHFPSGLLASCVSSYSFKEVKRYRVFGQEAFLDLDPATDYDKHEMKIGTEEGTTHAEMKEGNQFMAMLDHYSKCIRDNKPNQTPGEMGLRDMKIMAAIYEAARSGTRVKI